MATTARLGISIAAIDRTKQAFESISRGTERLKRSFDAIKFLLAGFVGGSFLEGMVQSFVDVSKRSAPVGASLDNLSSSWIIFGQKVGEAGLNQALIDFANRMSAMVTGTDGLARSIGSALGGGISGLGMAFEVVGRALAFAYDNMRVFIRAAAIYYSLRLAQAMASGGLAVLKLASALRAGAVVLGVFAAANTMTRNQIIGVTAFALAAVFSFESVMEQINQTMDKIEWLMGPTFDVLKQGMQAVGLDTSALEGDLRIISNSYDVFGGQLAPLGDSARLASGSVKELAPT